MADPATFLRRHWLRRSWLSYALWPLSLLYACVIGVRRALYRVGWLDATRVAVPVIVVGNFIAGGTGKTPLALWLVQRLRAAGRRPGIVSRGYGGTERGPRRVTPEDSAARVGDEPLLLATRAQVPVWIGRARARAAEALLAAHPEVDVIVCDDGLQHLALARDVEIAVVDDRGTGNGFLLPAGPLRERPRAVDALVRNDSTDSATAAGTFSMRLVPAGVYAIDRPEAMLDIAQLHGRRVCAIAGIGAPERFFRTVAALGIRASHHPFPDHHAFRAAELAIPECELVLMTEKDAVKCRGLGTGNLYALRVDAEVDDRLFERIAARLP
jgi:tetraacyldisaccharide 4'-kinase